MQYIEREWNVRPLGTFYVVPGRAVPRPDVRRRERGESRRQHIEAVQQVRCPGAGNYDPFLEFLVSRRYDEGPQFREQRAGGSGVIISEDVCRHQQPRRGRGLRLMR